MLKIFRDIRLGIKNLMMHGLRSLLTMLGMVFGVGSVIAMLSVGEGASQDALEQIRRLGSHNIIIDAMKPAQEQTSSSTRTYMNIYGLTYKDEARMPVTFSSIIRTVPAKIIRKEGRRGSLAMELRLVGTTPDWFNLVQRPLITGRTLTSQDLKTAANTVVLTEYGARRLLAMQTIIGEHIRIGGDYFKVVGIIQSEEGGSEGFQTPDHEIDAYIPLSTARQRYGDIEVRRTAGTRIRESVELHKIIVQVSSTAEVKPTADGIRTMLRKFHKKDDYRVSVPLALLRQAEATKRTFNIVLGSIAGISLLVGGIGIMNIMLASVTERTREIGIRRAIGAKRRHIIRQFLIETVVLSTTGGIIGIIIGFIIPWLITLFSGLTTVVTAFSLLLSLGISISVGIMFGIYPAYRAAQLHPIEALRHE